MIPGLDIMALSGWLLLASNQQVCSMTKAPNIVVTPSTAPIQYEFNLTSDQLTAIKSNTVSPYAPGTDTTTQGLRHDKPQFEYYVSVYRAEDTQRQTACFWYDKVEVKIKLAPKIYVAKEQSGKRCRDEIVKHELKHVDTDRRVINNHARNVGIAIQNAVNEIGVIGPYNVHEKDRVNKQLQEHIKSAIQSQESLLYRDMRNEQSKIDSLEEYERVNAICRNEQSRR